MELGYSGQPSQAAKRPCTGNSILELCEASADCETSHSEVHGLGTETEPNEAD
ncbi:hypothetical protein ZHAS_00021648 [Anopheles sinensis]|uniref:Uncharacterized protein n=1 Tax=Anopheles sinensis TaxID=74873 RepID=A0A084WSZ6_ANOSI|nr:hypothetical protein ZHAS_00021648 [Anopheles sinensis]